MSALAAIEQHHGVRLPDAYRLWVERRYTDYHSDNDAYLWVSEAEWIPPAEILTQDLGRDRLIPGLIPFAFTGAGDHWCWNTQDITGSNESEVLLCLHDEFKAGVFAPTFAAWFYRCCLHYASDVEDEEARAYLTLCSKRLADIGPRKWAEHLGYLAERCSFEGTPTGSISLISHEEIDGVVKSEFGDSYVESTREWGWYDDPAYAEWQEAGRKGPDESAASAARERWRAEIRLSEYHAATASADEAFRRRDYAACAAFFRPYEDLLTVAQKKKLMLCMRRTGGAP